MFLENYKKKTFLRHVSNVRCIILFSTLNINAFYRWNFRGLAICIRRECPGTLPLHARSCSRDAWDGWRRRCDSRKQFGSRENTFRTRIQCLSGVKTCRYRPRSNPATRACRHTYTRYGNSIYRYISILNVHIISVHV